MFQGSKDVRSEYSSIIYSMPTSGLYLTYIY